jgi:hypothetical protein
MFIEQCCYLSGSERRSSVVAASTGGVVLLVEHPLSTEVDDFAETPCKTLLWDDPRRNVAQSDNCLIIHTTLLQNSCVSTYVLLRFLNFDVPRCANFLCCFCHAGECSFICELDAWKQIPNFSEAIHKIPHEVHNLEARGVALSVGGIDKDHQNVISPYLSGRNTCERNSAYNWGFDSLYCIENIVITPLLNMFPICSRAGTSLLPTSLHIRKRLSDEGQCDTDIATDIPLQQRVHCRSHT